MHETTSLHTMGSVSFTISNGVQRGGMTLPKLFIIFFIYTGCAKKKKDTLNI